MKVDLLIMISISEQDGVWGHRDIPGEVQELTEEAAQAEEGEGGDDLEEFCQPLIQPDRQPVTYGFLPAHHHH